MSHTLRDSLDLSRQGVDELEVECVRLENKGVNSAQMYLSGSILIVCYLTLYMIPLKLIEASVEASYFRINLLFILIILGTVLCSVGIIPNVAKVYMEILFKFMP